MSLEQNKDLIRRLYDEGLNRQDAAAAAAFYAVNARNHGQGVGRGGMQKVFETLFAVFPDFHYRIEE
ncbi:MAG: ester cyclase, partial [Burkholderiales bacterium]